MRAPNVNNELWATNFLLKTIQKKRRVEYRRTLYHVHSGRESVGTLLVLTQLVEKRTINAFRQRKSRML